jgi:predicted GNAT superfamily acetyltransferase
LCRSSGASEWSERWQALGVEPQRKVRKDNQLTSDSVVIRTLTTPDECRKVAALEKAVWGFTDAEDVVPPSLLIVSIRRGGILLGAFEDPGTLRGFVYSMPAVKDRRLTHWSHMLGVIPDARGMGLGLRLKLAQREHAMRAGIDLIEWTFDPLQALNAHLNFARLGVIVEQYEEDLYGPSTSPLHVGTPTDRLVAEWRLSAPHVERRISMPGAPLVRDSSVMSAISVNHAQEKGEWLEPSPPRLDATERRLVVEIPTDFTEMQRRQPGLAMEWRLVTRSIFQTYLRRGYRIVDFLLAREAHRGQYLLALKPD